MSHENRRRKLWVKGVKTRWEPRPGLFSESANAIAEEILRAHDWDLASSVSSINFYINRAGEHLSDHELAKLEHARKLIQRGGYSREEQRELEARHGHRRTAANPGDNETLELAEDLRDQWLGGDRDAVIQTISDLEPCDAAMVAVRVFDSLNGDDRELFKSML